MIRCPRCGRRVRETEPVCAAHGALAALAGAPPPEASPQAWEERAAAALGARGYRTTRVLGRGGFGVVFSADRLRDGLPLAIKLALPEQPEAAARLRCEAAALARVGPPHVPALYDHGVLAAGEPFLALEYIAHPTLAEQLVQHDGPLVLPRFAALARALLRSLSAIHAAGIVHRDLKPENIFLAEQDQVRIIDFGSARSAHSGVELGAADDIGTAEYMAPEQCEGLPGWDPRSDLYSVGILWYELIHGAPPFWGAAADVREAQRSRRPLPFSRRLGCPPELEQVIRRCLAKDPARRFDDVPALQAALEAALEAAPRRVSHAPSVAPSRSTPSQHPRAPQQTREKRAVGLLFFESQAGLGNVQALVKAAGGELIQASGARYVAAFSHDLADNPARSALHAAERLLAGALATRVLVDVAAVSVQLRPDGSRRFFSPLLSKPEQFPSPADPAGAILTGAASEVLQELRVAPLAGRTGRFRVEFATAAEDATTFGIREASLVGRQELVDTLVAGARRALAERAPGLYTVCGEAGYGRSHVAAALAQRLEEPPDRASALEVWRLAAQETMVGAVSQTLPELLRRALASPSETVRRPVPGVPSAAPADGGRALWLERLGEVAGAELWAAAALTLGWIDADHPELRRVAAAPGALRHAAARAAGEALRTCARRAPLAIVVDDAQLADDATLDALEYATMKEAAAPIWACVFVRPGFERARPTWGGRAAQAQRLALGPLSASAAAELARKLLLPVEYVPPAVLARLVERTQGSPRLLVELIRGLKRDGLVRRSARGAGYYLATDELDRLPDLPIVEWNARRELDALPAQLAAHARLASVLGASFTSAELEQLMHALERDDSVADAPLDAAVGLSRLIAAGVLIRHRDGSIAFRHALLRDTVYRLLPEAQRAALHRAAFAMYQASALPDAQRLPRLALHAARSGQREAAADAYLELAERALAAHAYLEAEAAFGGALENLPASGDPRLVAAERGRGLMRFRLGRHDDALVDLRRARERAEPEDSARALELALDEATVLDWLLDYASSATLVRAVAAKLERAPAVPELLSARLSASLARVHHRLGEAEVCVRLGAEAAERARGLGDAGYETREIALLMIAPDSANLGRLEQAEQFFEAALAEAAAHADLHHLAAAHNNRASLWFARKDVPMLFQDLHRAGQIAREIGEPLLEYGALCNLAEVEYALEQLERAHEHTERALALARQLWGEANRERETRELMLARLALYRGDLTAARALAAGIRARAAAQPMQGGEELAFSPSDAALLESVELAASEAGEQAWEDFGQRYSALELQPIEAVELLEIRALAAFRRGARAASHALFTQAIELSRTTPNLLSDRVSRNLARLFDG